MDPMDPMATTETVMLGRDARAALRKSGALPARYTYGDATIILATRDSESHVAQLVALNINIVLMPEDLRAIADYHETGMTKKPPDAEKT